MTCWIFRIPYIIHLHGAEFAEFYEGELGRPAKGLVRFVFRHAACIIALSSTWKQWLCASMGLNNVKVVFNGVPFLEGLEHIEKHGPTVLFLGRLGARKGTDTLVEAMREVTKLIPDAVLELGGDGDIEVYRKQSADLPNVRFLGWVGEDDRKAALARATVYCLPSWNEGLPMSVLEAMSAGLPVVSTPVGGIPEAVEDGVSGFLVSPGDVQSLSSALCKLLLDPGMAESMGRIGRARHRESFSTEAMGRGCLAIYAECMTR